MTLINHRYKIVSALGEGGFGETFLVEDTQMPSRRQCVIKQLKPMNEQPAVFELVQQRFAREAAVLEAVGRGHSQIPDLYAYFEENGLFYLVQEWIEGKPLVDLVQEDWPEDRVRSLLRGTLNALDHVHSQNIIHRDIKPDNIIVRDSDHLPCLIDFGAVKELMGTVVAPSGSTQSSIVIGTPGFMPSEQAAGRPTFSSDLYSLGMTIIFLLTRRSPAELPTDSLTGEILWRQYAPGVSDLLANLLSRAVHPFAQKRFDTASSMLAALMSNALEPTQLAPGAISPDLATTSTAGANVGATVISTSGAQTIAPGTQLGNNTPTITQTSGQPDQSTGAPASTQKPTLPWWRISIASSAVVLAGLIWFGVRPMLTFDTPSSSAETEDVIATLGSLEAQVEDNPNDVDAQVRLAESYRQVGDYAEAIELLDTVLSQDESNVSALNTKGLVELDTGEYETALETFSQALEVESNSVTALIERGNVKYELGQYDEAIEDYRSALRIDPQNSQAYREWSAANLVQGNTQEALQNLDLAVERDENSIRALVSRGNRRSDLGDRVGAVEDWSKANSLDAVTADDYASRGFARSRLNNKQGAVEDYNQALIINPNHVRSLTNRAGIFYESGDTQQATETLNKALAVNPNSTIALLIRGEIKHYGNPSDLEGAVADYTQALEINPSDPDILNNRCNAYSSAGQLEQALADCDHGLTVNPRSSALYVARGNIRLSQENYDGAIQDYSRTIELGDEVGGDPRRQATAYSNRASARFQKQDLTGALNDINQALELKPDDAPDLYKRGLIKVALDDRAGARADLDRAAEVYIQEGRTDSHQNVIALIEELGL